MFDTTLLKPGDCLLYNSNGFWSLIIKIKTWHSVTHCECYIGDGYSIASRDGKGVNAYEYRADDLCAVLRIRPEYPFKLNSALTWFLRAAKGQGYDWWGLLRFTWKSDYCKGDKNNKQFCSEFLTRFYRNGGVDPFNGDDADAIPPFMFMDSPVFDIIWKDK